MRPNSCDRPVEYGDVYSDLMTYFSGCYHSISQLLIGIFLDSPERSWILAMIARAGSTGTSAPFSFIRTFHIVKDIYRRVQLDDLAFKLLLPVLGRASHIQGRSARWKIFPLSFQLCPRFSKTKRPSLPGATISSIPFPLRSTM